MGPVVTLHMQSFRSNQGFTLFSETNRTGRPYKPLPLAQMDYEAKFYPRIGGFGRYTKKVVVWSWFPSFAVALSLTSPVFFTMSPETFYCNPTLIFFPTSNFTWEEVLRANIPVDEMGNWSRCEQYSNGSTEASKNSNWWQKVPCTNGWHYITKDGLKYNFVTEVCQQLQGVFFSLFVSVTPKRNSMVIPFLVNSHFGL